MARWTSSSDGSTRRSCRATSSGARGRDRRLPVDAHLADLAVPGAGRGRRRRRDERHGWRALRTRCRRRSTRGSSTRSSRSGPIRGPSHPPGAPTSDEPERPLLVAYPHPGQGTSADVFLAWKSAPATASPELRRRLEGLLCSWVVEQLEASSRLRRVRLYFRDGESWESWGKVALASATRTRRIPRPVSAWLRRRGVLRKQTNDPSRERYLVRQFELRRPGDARWRRALGLTPKRSRRPRASA